MREMNARADNRNSGAPQKTDTPSQVKLSPSNKPKSTLPKTGFDLPFGDLLKNGDTALILGLLLILFSENADKRLLFALVYILL